MSDLFDTPSRRYLEIAKCRLVVKGYPEYDESQARAADGTWGGGSGGGSSSAGQGKDTKSGWKKLVAMAGGVAALAATLAAAGVPVLRGLPGLRHARRAVLATRHDIATRRARSVGIFDTIGLGRQGPHVRAETEVLRQRLRLTPQGRRMGLSEYTPSPAAQRRYAQQHAQLRRNPLRMFDALGNPPSIRR